jgi:hypothetical protein
VFGHRCRVLVRFVFSCHSRSLLWPGSLHLSSASVFLVPPVKLRTALGFQFYSRRKHSGLHDFPPEESILPPRARRQGRISFPLTCEAPRPAFSLPRAGFVFHCRFFILPSFCLISFVSCVECSVRALLPYVFLAQLVSCQFQFPSASFSSIAAFDWPSKVFLLQPFCRSYQVLIFMAFGSVDQFLAQGFFSRRRCLCCLI